MSSPFAITIFDKAFTRTAWVTDPLSVSVTARHNAVGTASFELPLNHRLLPELVVGSRVTFDYLGEQMLSGPIRPKSFEGPTITGTMVVNVEDDLRTLFNLHGYPVPGSPIDSQSAGSDTRTGPAETVVKGFVSANVARWGRPITVATNLGRGSTVTVSVRMLPLSDVLFPVVDQAGIGVTVRQVGTGLVVDCYASSLFPLTLSEGAGTVIGYSGSQEPPTATRAIIGGPNTGSSREWRLVIDSARESQWGDVIEMLVDASDEAVPSKILARGTQALVDAGPTSALTVALTETSVFHYGGADGLHVGDLVPVETAPGLPLLTDVLREATVTWDRDNGITTGMSIGTDEASADKKLAAILDQLAKGVRQLRAR